MRDLSLNSISHSVNDRRGESSLLRLAMGDMKEVRSLNDLFKNKSRRLSSIVKLFLKPNPRFPGKFSCSINYRFYPR